MLKVLGKIKYILFFVLVMACVDCASSKKQNPYYAKRLEASKVNTTQLGRNRYYYSSGYKKKIEKSHKTISKNRY